MARPTSEGLTYFSLDVDIDQEDKVAYIESKHGLIGFGIIIRLLMRIYRNGYYMAWTEREQYLFAKNVTVDIATVLTVVNDCINEGIFNKELYEKYNILTSRGIQKRYLKGCERRKKIIMLNEYFLVNPSQDDVKIDNVTLTTINGDIIPFNSDIMSAKTPQSKVKKSKVKESKELHADVDQDDLYPSGNAGEETPARIAPANQGPVVESSEITGNLEFMAFWRAYPKKSGMALAFEAWSGLIAQGIKSADLALAASKYSMRMKADGTAVQFMKSPCKFMNEQAYIDYLPYIATSCPRCKGRGWYVGTVPTSYGGEREGTIQCDCRTEMAVARG